MSLPRSSRSINRRLPPVRSLTLPASTSTTTTRTTTTTTTASTIQESSSSSYTGTKDIESFLPSIDESLQDWLTRNVPDTTHSPSLFYSLLEDPCPCCKRLNCEHLETLYKSIRKLEMDARLAAEIGQSLLHKHEALIAETNRTKDVLEKQVNECHEKITTLEQLLIDTDNSKLEMMEQRDQSIRKWQKTEQALQDTSIELEKANERCLELGNELKNKTKEVEKLRVFKMMARQADYHEDVLRSQLEDTNQELAITRKNELMLESKYKQLKSRYEMVCSSYEKLKLNDSTVGQNTNYQVNTLKESNEKLRNDIIKLTSLIPNTQYELNDKQPEQAYMISLIKELALANTKLRMELINKDNAELYNINDPISQESDILMNDNDYISKAFMDAYNNEDDLFHHDTKLEDPTLSCNNTLIDDNNNNNIPRQQPSSSTKVINTDLNNNNNNNNTNNTNTNNNNKNNDNDNDNDNDNNHNDDTLIDSPIPSPSTSSSPIKSEVVHYHFHYHLKNKKRQLAKKNDYAKASKNKTTIPNYDTTITSSSDITSELDPSSSTTMLSKDTPVTCKDCKDDSPYHKLQLNVSHYLDRLKSTDICSLNRRLRRTFDMMELSNMSNSIIENILLDIKTIQDHFSWVKEQYNYNNEDNNGNDDDNDQQQQQSIFISAFYPTLHLFQFMLTEIGELRMAMNHLQVDYVKKVEEMDIFVKEDILRKQNENVKQQSSTSTTTTTITNGPSSSSSTRAINKNSNNNNNNNNNTYTSITATSTATERMINNNNNSNGSTNNNKSAFSWLSNVFQIQTQNASSTTAPSASISSETHRYKVRYQRSCDSISTSKFHGGDNNADNVINNNNNKFPIMTTSCSLRVQQKRNDMDKFGPPSSFPRAIHINDPKNKRRRSTSIHTKSMIYPLKPSQSTGPKSSSSSSSFSASAAAGIGWPPTTSSSCLTEEVAIQRKRSLLGLGNSNSNSNHHQHTVSDPMDKVNAVDWKLGTSYGSSWLGSNF